MMSCSHFEQNNKFFSFSFEARRWAFLHTDWYFLFHYSTCPNSPPPSSPFTHTTNNQNFTVIPINTTTVALKSIEVCLDASHTWWLRSLLKGQFIRIMQQGSMGDEPLPLHRNNIFWACGEMLIMYHLSLSWRQVWKRILSKHVGSLGA